MADEKWQMGNGRSVLSKLPMIAGEDARVVQ
jgi:hypothetical protein